LHPIRNQLNNKLSKTMKRIITVIACTAMSFCALQSVAQDTKIRLFGQPEYFSQRIRYQNPNGAPGKKDSSTTNYNTGNLVLFVTSQLSERVSVLSEVSFNNTGNVYKFDVQRLMLRYYIKDYFSIRFGKMFTPIGYWNNQFTLGLVLQPTIQRPFAIRTTDDGGVLQYKDVGVQFEGENITSARVFYKLMLANGVGYYGSSDKGDNHVAATGQIGIEPIDGFKISGSGQFDRIEKGKPNPNGTIAALPDNGNYALLFGSIAYMNPEKKPELIAEFSTQTSKFNTLGTTHSKSGYIYGGYKITNKITPYAMYNYTQAGKSTTTPDPYFSPLPAILNTLNLGVRYKFNSSFVAKLEYQINKEKDYYGVYGGLTSTTSTNSVRAQLAFVF
jgi:opacity protein-like surface antigen